MGSSNYTAHWPSQPASWVGRSVGRLVRWLLGWRRSRWSLRVNYPSSTPHHHVAVAYQHCRLLLTRWLLLFGLSCRYFYFFSICCCCCCLHCIESTLLSADFVCIPFFFHIYFAVCRKLPICGPHTIAQPLISLAKPSQAFVCLPPPHLIYQCVRVCVRVCVSESTKFDLIVNWIFDLMFICCYYCIYLYVCLSVGTCVVIVAVARSSLICCCWASESLSAITASI